MQGARVAAFARDAVSPPPAVPAHALLAARLLTRVLPAAQLRRRGLLSPVQLRRRGGRRLRHSLFLLLLDLGEPPAEDLDLASQAVARLSRRTLRAPPQSDSPGFAQPTSLAGRVKQTRQRTLTKPPHNFPRFNRNNICKHSYAVHIQ